MDEEVPLTDPRRQNSGNHTQPWSLMRHCLELEAQGGQRPALSVEITIKLRRLSTNLVFHYFAVVPQ